MGEHREAHRPAQALRRRRGGRRGRDPHDASATSRSAARGCASATTAATRSAASTPPRFEFTGGAIVKVVFDVADDAYVDVEATRRRDGRRPMAPKTDLASWNDTRDARGDRRVRRARDRRRAGLVPPPSASRCSTTTARCGARSRCRSSSASSCSGWRRWPSADPALRERQPWKAALRAATTPGSAARSTKHYDGDDSDVKVLMGGMLQAFAGMTVDDYAAQAAAFLRDGASTRRSAAATATAATCRWSSCCATSRRTASPPTSPPAATATSCAPIAERDLRHPARARDRQLERARATRTTSTARSSSTWPSPTSSTTGPAKPVRIWSRIGRRPIARRRQLERRHPDAALRRRPARRRCACWSSTTTPSASSTTPPAPRTRSSAARDDGWTVVSIKDDWATVFADL